jgi:hypothetical protein
MRNKLLYSKLQTLMGSVLISNEGGEDEDYRVCCPYCGDTRHRLYISYRWGVYDPITASNNDHLIFCFNENCVQPDPGDPGTYDERRERRKDFLLRVYRGLNGIAAITPAVPPAAFTGEPLAWPGKVIRLDKLFVKLPEHPAIVYMQGRGFDPVQLGREYGFVFCDKVTDMKYTQAFGRILMPVYRHEALYSWIGRLPFDPPSDSKIKVKKYYNCPGRPLQAVGYNLDLVSQYRTVVIVEGILDAVKTGPFATCLFSKTLSQALKKKIVRILQRYGSEATAVVMLDPKQNEKERLRNVKHPIEAVADALAEYIPNVLRVYLPPEHDPGSMTSEKIMQSIQQAARTANIQLLFEKQT